jgi:predicted Rossmann fold flavoprotein
MLNSMSGKNHENNIYDVIVIGGGPAGMMSAGTAGALGLKVLLLEKNPSLGKKLLITGGGRCNVTNAELDMRVFLANFKEDGRFLFSTFAQHGVADTLAFFNERGMATKVEENKRVFPVSDTAQSVLKALQDYMAESQVAIKTRAEVRAIRKKDDHITAVELTDGTLYQASAYILATGGKSRPDTGSTGDGFVWLRELGHTIINPDPSLVPLVVKESWVSELAGLTLPEVKINVYHDKQKVLSKKGRVLFTHVGISGPTILNMSKIIGEWLSHGSVTLALDLFPADDVGSLDNKLIALFAHSKNKFVRNALTPFLPPSLADQVLRLTKIDPETKCHSLTKEERRRLLDQLKDFRLSVIKLLGAEKAIVTSGGVALTEVDFRTMRSRIVNNLFLTGDILNIDRPSGGFSLQLCWSTGYVAGQSVVGVEVDGSRPRLISSC